MCAWLSKCESRSDHYPNKQWTNELWATEKCNNKKNKIIIYGCRLFQNIPLESWIETFSSSSCQRIEIRWPQTASAAITKLTYANFNMGCEHMFPTSLPITLPQIYCCSQLKSSLGCDAVVELMFHIRAPTTAHQARTHAVNGVLISHYTCQNSAGP